MKKFFAPVALTLFIFCLFPVSAKTAAEIIKEMGAGWNLGNTLDAAMVDGANSGKHCGLETETSWGMPKTTEAVFDTIKAAGFTSVRIPVSWHNHLTNGKIDAEWMARVKEVVDWAIARELYVVINVHHDNWSAAGEFWGYYPDAEHKNASIEFVKNMWTQIAAEFANYDERLVFETLNEPCLRNTKHEWWCSDYYNGKCSACKTTAEITNELNQIALDIIRNSGGNNATRLVIVPSVVAAPEYALLNDFALPNDPSKKLALSVHMYKPYSFAMECPGEKAFSEKHANELTDAFNNLQKKFGDKGVPVFIGEFSATNKGNKAERVKWVKHFVKGAGSKGMAYCLWDNNDYNKNPDLSERHGHLNRKSLVWYDVDFVTALINLNAETEKPAKAAKQKKAKK